MMDLGNILSGAGVMLGMSMAGAGALKMFLAAAHGVARIPEAMEKIAGANERQAAAAETQARLVPVLEKLESRREEIENSISVLARNYEETENSISVLARNYQELAERVKSRAL